MPFDRSILQFREDLVDLANRFLGKDQPVEVSDIAAIDEPFQSAQHVPNVMCELTVVHQCAAKGRVGSGQILSYRAVLGNQMRANLIDLMSSMPAVMIGQQQCRAPCGNIQVKA